MRTKTRKSGILILSFLFSLSCAACAGRSVYHDPMMDFSGIRSVAIMPLQNYSSDRYAADRVRDAFMTSLLATGSIYVVPPGEVERGISRARVNNPSAPSSDEIRQLGSILKVDAIITGTIREYGQVRSSNAEANVISLSLQMLETQTGKAVWSASTTRGGIGVKERLFGGGGQPMNEITVAAVQDLLDKLFR